MLIILWCRTAKYQNALVSVNDVKFVSLKLLSKFILHCLQILFSILELELSKAVQAAKQKNNKKCCNRSFGHRQHYTSSVRHSTAVLKEWPCLKIDYVVRFFALLMNYYITIVEIIVMLS